MNAIMLLQQINSNETNKIVGAVKDAIGLSFNDFKYLLNEAVLTLSTIQDKKLHEIEVEDDYKDWTKKDIYFHVASIEGDDPDLLTKLLKANRATIMVYATNSL